MITEPPGNSARDIDECPHGHAPRKAVYPDGREYHFPRPTCKQCGYNVTRESLQLTNRRLVGYIDYRLGYLTGKLKAHERDEDLIKLGKEIKEGK